MKATATGLGIILSIATAMINFAIQQWNSDNQLIAAIFFAIGGSLYIVGAYYGMNKAKKVAVREAIRYFEARLREEQEARRKR